MDAKLPGKVRIGNGEAGVIVAYQEVRASAGLIQARCSNLLRVLVVKRPRSSVR